MNNVDSMEFSRPRVLVKTSSGKSASVIRSEGWIAEIHRGKLEIWSLAYPIPLTMLIGLGRVDYRCYGTPLSPSRLIITPPSYIPHHPTSIIRCVHDDWVAEVLHDGTLNIWEAPFDECDIYDPVFSLDLPDGGGWSE